MGCGHIVNLKLGMQIFIFNQNSPALKKEGGGSQARELHYSGMWVEVTFLSSNPIWVPIFFKVKSLITLGGGSLREG